MNGETSEKAPSYGRRAASYWFIDGLPELLFGLATAVFSGLALFFCLNAPARWMPSGSIRPDACIFFGGLALYCYMERRILDALKSRVTYPRTGYVAPPEEQERKAATLTVLNLHPVPPLKENVSYFRLRTGWPIAIFGWMFWLNGNPFGRWLPLAVMPAMAITLYFVNRKSDHSYSWFAALILGLTGPSLMLFNVPAFYQLPLPMLLVGAWLAAQGLFTLVHYLHANPLPDITAGARV